MVHLLLLLRNMLRTGIKDKIENEFNLPVYATVPRSPIQETRISIFKEKKNYFLSLRLNIMMILQLKVYVVFEQRFILHSKMQKNNIILSLRRSFSEVGKSFISTNLATILAKQTNKKVLLIDADMRHWLYA